MAAHAPPALQKLLEDMIKADRKLRPITAKELVARFKDIAVAGGGDLYAVRQELATCVDEHYAKGALTERSMTAMPRPDSRVEACGVSAKTAVRAGRWGRRRWP